MKCTKCGADIPSGSKFCENCGQKVQETETTNMPPIDLENKENRGKIKNFFYKLKNYKYLSGKDKLKCGLATCGWSAIIILAVVLLAIFLPPAINDVISNNASYSQVSVDEFIANWNQEALSNPNGITHGVTIDKKKDDIFDSDTSFSNIQLSESALLEFSRKGKDLNILKYSDSSKNDTYKQEFEEILQILPCNFTDAQKINFINSYNEQDRLYFDNTLGGFNLKFEEASKNGDTNFQLSLFCKPDFYFIKDNNAVSMAGFNFTLDEFTKLYNESVKKYNRSCNISDDNDVGRIKQSDWKLLGEETGNWGVKTKVYGQRIWEKLLSNEIEKYGDLALLVVVKADTNKVLELRVEENTANSMIADESGIVLQTYQDSATSAMANTTKTILAELLNLIDLPNENISDYSTIAHQFWETFYAESNRTFFSDYLICGEALGSGNMPNVLVTTFIPYDIDKNPPVYQIHKAKLEESAETNLKSSETPQPTSTVTAVSQIDLDGVWTNRQNIQLAKPGYSVLYEDAVCIISGDSVTIFDIVDRGGVLNVDGSFGPFPATKSKDGNKIFVDTSEISMQIIGGNENTIEIQTDKILVNGSTYRRVEDGIIMELMESYLSDVSINVQTTGDFDENGFVFPDSDSRYLSYEEVEALFDTAQMDYYELLGYARNEIFARHGNEFDSSKYTNHYSQYSWYNSLNLHKVQDSELNDYEKSNIQTIQDAENTPMF